MIDHLIILAKNPELGKVKTRLAVGIGHKYALEVYKRLLKHTREVASLLEVKKTVFFTNSDEPKEIWEEFSQKIQQGLSLGDRMFNAIKNNDGHSVIIGTDCIDLTKDVLEDAFKALNKFDVVIGPAEDGGYYLIGMKEPIKALFENKKWSTESVFIDTIEDIKRLGLTHFTLPTLSDIDTLDDLKKSDLYNYYEQFILRNN